MHATISQRKLLSPGGKEKLPNELQERYRVLTDHMTNLTAIRTEAEEEARNYYMQNILMGALYLLRSNNEHVRLVCDGNQQKTSVTDSGWLWGMIQLCGSLRRPFGSAFSSSS